MKKIRNIILGVLAAGMLTVTAPVGGMQAYASSAKISFSDPSATVGQEFSVNVKISSQDGNLGASDVVLSYDPSVIEFVSGNNASGGAGSVRLVGTMDSSSTKAFSYTLKFKAIQAGNTSISVGDYEVYDVDAKAVTVSKPGTATVKVKAPATSSVEAALSSLKVSPGQLSPAFSPNVTAYTVQVSAGVDKLAVSATPKDGKAKVLVSGDSGLKVGANTVVCKVTAEDGQTSRNYTITVNKLDTVEVPSEAVTEAVTETEAESVETTSLQTNGLNVEIDGVSYTVAESFDASLLPDGYTQTTCTYGDTEVACGTGNDLTLLYLQDAEGNGAFYIYMPDSGAMSPYVTIDVTAKSILVLPPDDTVQIPEGFAETTIQLNGSYKVQGWVWKNDEDQQYCVIYGMNESGEKSLYRYDIAEKTFQRYFEDPALETMYDEGQVNELIDQYNTLCQDYNSRLVLILILCGACVILFIMVIHLLLKRKEWKEKALAEIEKNSLKRRAQPSAAAKVERGYQSADEEMEHRRPSARRESERRRPSVARKEEYQNERRVREGEGPLEPRKRQQSESGTGAVRRSKEESTALPEQRKRNGEMPSCQGRTPEKRRSKMQESDAIATSRPQEFGFSEEKRRRRPEREMTSTSEKRRLERERTDILPRRAAEESAASKSRSIERSSIQVRPARQRSELYYTLEREEYEERPTRYEASSRTLSSTDSYPEERNGREVERYKSKSYREREAAISPKKKREETERARQVREAKARLERSRRDEDGFEYVDPQ